MENVEQFPESTEKKLYESEPQKSQQLKKIQLINKLNYINFKDGTIYIYFRHVRYNRSMHVPAKPQPCLADTLDCIWLEPKRLRQKLKNHKFQDFRIPDGQKLIIVKPQIVSISGRGICFRLPDSCMEISKRKSKRYQCEGIQVQLIQNSVLFSGILIDFSASSFSIKVEAFPPQTFQWIYPKSTVTIILSDQRETVYSGECKVLRQSLGQKTRIFVLKPLTSKIHRFRPKEYRSAKQKLIPSPDIIFKHPLTKKKTNLRVVDVSGLGISVRENEDNPLLLPGMIIPEMKLSFAKSFTINCRSQVVHKATIDDEEGDTWIKCGLVFLDMNTEDHLKLLSLLQQINDKRSYICNDVDLDKLWNFFFDAGFIYPQKYAFLKQHKENIKKTYENLYTRNSSIARHFIYQDNGTILGHMAMIRFYHNSWLIHHHAADRKASIKAGLTVLDQISHYINEVHNIYSHHMDFVFCYYRPDNKFPDRVFGGVSRSLNNQQGCSLDTFAYFHGENIFSNELDIIEPWELCRTTPEDLEDLESFYDEVSGGLMIPALDLEPNMMNIHDVAREYQSLGLKRERHLLSLKKDGSLKAVVIVNISNLGLNMSDLTNCIKIIVLDPDNLPVETLNSIISLLCAKYKQDDIPVLLYPVSYAKSQGITFDKCYNLWILSMHHTDDYFRYLERLLRFVKH